MLNILNHFMDSLDNKKVSYKKSIQFKEIKKNDKISILSDSMMKTMFQNENRLKYSAKLLSYYLDIPYEDLLNNMHLSKNEFDKKFDNYLGLRGDFVATIGDTVINIEINNNGNSYIMERNLEYSHRLFSKNVRKNKKDKVKHKYKYTQVIQLCINNFKYEGNDEVEEVFYLQNSNSIKYTRKLIYIQIYIPNLIQK